MNQLAVHAPQRWLRILNVVVPKISGKFLRRGRAVLVFVLILSDSLGSVNQSQAGGKASPTTYGFGRGVFGNIDIDDRVVLVAGPFCVILDDISLIRVS